MSSGQDSVAIYWDFENLHASLLEELHGPGAYQASRYVSQDAVVDVTALVDFARSHGPLAINRAFANWSYLHRYKHALLQSAVELIQMFPPGSSAKNGADIKLCLDAAEDMARFPHIGTVVVVGGDSDYMPLSFKLKAAGRRLIGIGARRATNTHWASSCHEFVYYEDLIAPPEAPASALPRPESDTDTVDAVHLYGPGAARPSADAVAQAPTHSADGSATEPDAAWDGGAPADPAGEVFSALVAEDCPTLAEARELVRRALQEIGEKIPGTWINKARLKPHMRAIDSMFHESSYGFSTFNQFLASMPDVVEIRKGESDHELRLKP